MVDGSSEDSAQNRSNPVDPVVVEFACSNGGTESACRIESAASVWDGKQVTNCHRQPHSQGGVELEKDTAVQLRLLGIFLGHIKQTTRLRLDKKECKMKLLSINLSHLLAHLRRRGGKIGSFQNSCHHIVC